MNAGRLRGALQRHARASQMSSVGEDTVTIEISGRRTLLLRVLAEYL